MLKKYLWILLIGSVLGIAGCNRSEGKVLGGESSQVPYPVLLDAVLARGIYEGNPVGVTNQFQEGDTVYVYTLWAEVENDYPLSFFFYTPDNELADSITILLKKGSYSTGIAYFKPSFQNGVWGVDIYLNGVLKRSLDFEVKGSSD